MNHPDTLWYTREHEWIHAGDDGVWRVGITDYAQQQLGGVVFVELPSVGDHLEAGDALASLESVKAVADVGMPAEGDVTAVNDALEDRPELLNEAPYEHWIAEIRPDRDEPDTEWMDASDYAAFCEDL